MNTLNLGNVDELEFADALEIVAHAARRFAQEIADDPNSTDDDKRMEQEIWDALARLGTASS